MQRGFCPSRWEPISAWCGRQGSPASLAPAARWANQSVPGTTPQPADAPRPAPPEFPPKASGYSSRVSPIVRHYDFTTEDTGSTEEFYSPQRHGEHRGKTKTSQRTREVKEQRKTSW